MKYMGSKRSMLANGLGEVLLEESRNKKRFVDLFCGGGSVSWFAASRLNVPVFSCDLQEYAVTLAGAVGLRRYRLDAVEVADRWLGDAERLRRKNPLWLGASKVDCAKFNTTTWKKRAVDFASNAELGRQGPIFRSYAGHYYSPTQSLTLDAMLSSLPDDKVIRKVCLAATLVSGSACAASPGHTAQPFSAKGASGKYLREGWSKEPLHYAVKALEKICPIYAQRVGKAMCGDANKVAQSLGPQDLVFIDPPYSGVHYSRFYHVLETIARGWCGAVSGIGRYPPQEERPKSNYSQKTKSKASIEELFYTLANSGCKSIVTFPGDACSNGLSGEIVEESASKYFEVTRRVVKTRFSTLGGNLSNRSARKVADELILVLRPLQL